MTNVFIDGKEGTTGLQIYERLGSRDDVSVTSLPDELRKDPVARKKCINEADIVFLCLPDAAARESVSLCENPDVKIIDASTAHRTSPDWAYGFPELSAKHREKIALSRRVAVPGCHASGFVSLVYPLVAGGIVPADYPFVAYSVTGYSGGGKKMIAEYESKERSVALDSPRQYGLGQVHKHLKEMQAVCGLENAPVFSPVVAPFYAGMQVTLQLYKPAAELEEIYKEHYKNAKLVRVEKADAFGGYLPANAFAGRDDMLITVCGNDERAASVALFDNLGKGASGAAVQNMNVMFGLPEETGLEIGK